MVGEVNSGRWFWCVKRVGIVKIVMVVNPTIQSVGWVLVASIRTRSRRKQK